MDKTIDYINKNVKGLESYIEGISKITNIDFVSKYNSYKQKHIGSEITLPSGETARANSTVSSQALFGYLQTLARPKDEVSATNRCFEEVQAGTPGDTSVNLASLQNSGEATTHAVGSQQDSKVSTAKSEAKLLDVENHAVYDVSFSISVTRDDVLQVEAMSKHGNIPGFSLLETKIEYAMKAIHKKLDNICFNGIGSGQLAIPGFLNRFGTNKDFETRPAGAVWSASSGKEIIERDIQGAIASLTSTWCLYATMLNHW